MTVEGQENEHGGLVQEMPGDRFLGACQGIDDVHDGEAHGEAHIVSGGLHRGKQEQDDDVQKNGP